jgi:hypothetical protein
LSLAGLIPTSALVLRQPHVGGETVKSRSTPPANPHLILKIYNCLDAYFVRRVTSVPLVLVTLEKTIRYVLLPESFVDALGIFLVTSS